ncbi:RNA-directed DNA polymerase, eukaryota, reverse transcriptase zinc-binding domain protein [Tanacetum coccineum]
MYTITNGKSISVWHAKWCDQGPLDRFIHSREIHDARMSNNDYLADVIQDGRWMWPSEWNSMFSKLSQINVPNLSQKDDTAMWVYENKKIVQYSTKVVWLTMRDKWPKVDWWHVVWFSQCSPKQAIILWMAIQGKLLTQDKMVWFQGGDLKCSLCKVCADSHNMLKCLRFKKSKAVISMAEQWSLK